MKKSSQKNSGNLPKESGPKESEAIISGEKIPSGLDFPSRISLPQETLAELFPTLQDHAALAAIFSGFQIYFGIEVPEWAAKASSIFWEALGLNSPPQLDSPSDMGKIVGLLETLPTPRNPETTSERMEKSTFYFCQRAKMKAANASAENSKQFFDQRLEGKGFWERIDFLPQRQKIFRIIMVEWQEIAKLKSTGEFHQWLLALRNKEGKPAIAPNTDSREIRKICQSIKLEFPNQWQKQKHKPNPGPHSPI